MTGSARTASRRLVLLLAVELAALLATVRLPAAAAGSDALDVVAGSGRWVAAALLGYLVLVTVLQLAALATGAARAIGRRFAQLSSRLGPGAVAGIAAATMASAPLASAAVTRTPAGSVPDSSSDRTPVVMVLEGDPGGSAQPDPAQPDPAQPDPGPAPAPVAAEAVTMDALDEPERSEPGPPRSVEVDRGDSLWSMSERELGERLGRAPTDAETTTYWRVVVELNRSRLVDPDDPGRIYAGQRIVLP